MQDQNAAPTGPHGSQSPVSTHASRSGDSAGEDEVAQLQRLSITETELYSSHESEYYQFPQVDFEEFFAMPVLHDSVKDKLGPDAGATASKRAFPDKVRDRFEETLKKVDVASRFGMRSTSFLLLLTEYLAMVCEEDSDVPADMLRAAFQCLDHGLKTALDQFAQVTTLATRARRCNALDALFLPSPGARKRFEALPLAGGDLFAGKFEELMQAEANQLKDTEKINLKKPAGPSAKPLQARGKPSFVIPQHKPFKPPHGAFRNCAASSAGPSLLLVNNAQLPVVASEHRPPATSGAGGSDVSDSRRPPIVGLPRLCGVLGSGNL